MGTSRLELHRDAADGSVLARVGAWLGAPLASELDALALMRRGLTPAQFRRVATRFDLPRDLPASASTVRRREKKKERFTQAESERVLRVLRVLAEAREFFGGDSQAIAWMHRAANFVPGKPDLSPMQLAAGAEAGARHLEGLIRRSAYGML